MIYQITAPKEEIQPIIKESLKRSNMKYLKISYFVLFILWTFIIFSWIFDLSLISRVSIAMYEDYGLFLSAQQIQVTILFIFLICLFFVSILLLIVYLVYNKACKLYPYYKFDIDLKNETVKVGKNRLSKKISWHRSFVYDEDTIVLKLKSDIRKGLSIIIFKNEDITDEDFNYLVKRIAKG